MDHQSKSSWDHVKSIVDHIEGVVVKNVHFKARKESDRIKGTIKQFDAYDAMALEISAKVNGVAIIHNLCFVPTLFTQSQVRDLVKAEIRIFNHKHLTNLKNVL